MTNTKLSPRQKMINMLYLVLTAILALNVSSEVLDAFKTVNDGIGYSNYSLQSKNSGFYSSFATQLEHDSARVDTTFRKAKKARELSLKFTAMLETLKKQMIEEAGGVDAVTGKIKRDDDIKIPTRLFVENQGKRGKELKKEMETIRAELLGLLNAKDRKAAEQSLSLKVDEPIDGKSWEVAKFNQVPVVAAVTLLSKYQNDMLSAEGHVVETLYNSIYEKTEKVDKLAAKIISPSSFILQGESYKADVMVAAYSSTQNPEVFLGQFTGVVKRDDRGNPLELTSKSDVPPLVNAVKIDVEGGLGKIALAGNATGNKKYSGVVRVKSNATGEFKFYPFEGDYQVAPKVAVVSPKMMNVLYIGLDNPVDVSVPGMAQSDISASLSSNGTLVRGSDGSYNAKVTTIGTANVVVKAKVNGRNMVMGQHPFRIKKVPSPVTTLDGVYEGGKIPIAKIKSTRGIVAVLKAFDYPANFTVESFEVSHKSKREDNISVPVIVNGPAFNQKVKDMMKSRIEAGDDIYFDEIWVRGPAGDRRKINPISFAIVR
jgi:gliding motility-associated protein GldM